MICSTRTIPIEPEKLGYHLLESQQQRTATPENSHQSHEQENKRKKVRTHEFNEVRQLLTSAGQKGKGFLNQSSTRFKQEGQYPRVYENKKTNHSEFELEKHSESNLKTVKRPYAVDRPIGLPTD